MILFLDFDGVLHPSAVFMTPGGLELQADGTFFMWADRLTQALGSHPDIQIVLSTSWARHLGFDAARNALPAALSARVIDATWHPDAVDWDHQYRYEQISEYLSHLNEPVRWLAIDDDIRGWPESARDNLVQTHAWRGLSDISAQWELSRKLDRLSH